MESIITIRNLSKNYGTHQVLKNINLDIPKGQIIGYIGPNGAGKSTTVKIMLGLVGEYSGDIHILGNNIGTGDNSYKKKIDCPVCYGTGRCGTCHGKGSL